MGVTERGALPRDLVRVQSLFLAWRRRRRKAGSRIPQSLWRRAVRLVSAHGISRTAQALGVDYYSLKKQVEAAADQPPARAPAFVELPSPVLASKQCLFELDNGAGTTMRVQLTGYDATDIAVLSRSFWGGQ